MKLFQKRNKKLPEKGTGLVDEPYLILNLFFAGVIILVIIYSGFFSPDKDNYPVVCLHERLTGQPCISCGLSHSLSLIVRGRISEAQQWNIYGMRIFLFFVAQLFLRFVFSAYYLRTISFRKPLIILDSIGSGLMLLFTFWPFIMSIIRGFAEQL